VIFGENSYSYLLTHVTKSHIFLLEVTKTNSEALKENSLLLVIGQ